MTVDNTGNTTDDSDDAFGDFVKREARDYNLHAAAVPREEMWTAIASARVEARNGARRSAAARKRYAWIGAGMAATLVIGVALGRYARSADSTRAASEVASADTGNTSYRVATATHLVGAEALLTSFTSTPAGTKTDSAVARWARELLSNTRLLIDSPAASDATRKRLLEDLERVLVQIVQTSPAESNAEMRAHVERSMDRTHMITRLRALQLAAPGGGSEE